MNQSIMEQAAHSVLDFRLPRYNEIPNVGLYLEQVTRYLSECFSPLNEESITASMISNYVKRGLITNPTKKQYTREQIAYLIFILTVKKVLSMEDIKLFISLQKRTYTIPVAYDYFICEFENVLQYIFGCKDTLDTVGVENTNEKFMLRHAIITAARTRPKLIGGERACYTEE